MKKLIFIFTIILSMYSCTSSTQNNTSQKTYKYTVVDKSKDIECRYNFIFNKFVVDTIEKLVVKDDYGNIIIIRNERMYYQYNVGDSFISSHRYY